MIFGLACALSSQEMVQEMLRCLVAGGLRSSVLQPFAPLAETKTKRDIPCSFARPRKRAGQTTHVSLPEWRQNNLMVCRLPQEWFPVQKANRVLSIYQVQEGGCEFNLGEGSCPSTSCAVAPTLGIIAKVDILTGVQLWNTPLQSAPDVPGLRRCEFIGDEQIPPTKLVGGVIPSMFL